MHGSEPGGRRFFFCTLHCVAVYCSVLQYVVVCCSMFQCVAVCCSVLPSIHSHIWWSSVLKCVA